MQCKRGEEVELETEDKISEENKMEEIGYMRSLFLSYAEYISHNIDTKTQTLVAYKVSSLFGFELSFSHTKTTVQKYCQLFCLRAGI